VLAAPDLDKKNEDGSRCVRLLLQTQVFSIGQVNELYIGLTQENSIENSVQDCLPYILKLHGPC